MENNPSTGFTSCYLPTAELIANPSLPDNARHWLSLETSEPSSRQVSRPGALEKIAEANVLSPRILVAFTPPHQPRLQKCISLDKLDPRGHASSKPVQR